MSICLTRGWVETGGLHELARRGLLWFGMMTDDGKDWPAWIIADSSRRNAQGRRLDGKPWSGIGAKAKTVRYGDPSWPIGAADVGDHQHIILTEGGPDFLAALYVAGWEGCDVGTLAPVCMTGASNAIHPDALPVFREKKIRIAVHDDIEGQRAANRWAGQLYSAGAAEVSGFSFHGLAREDGSAIEDLADFATLFDSGEAPPLRMTDGFCPSCQLTPHPRTNGNHQPTTPPGLHGRRLQRPRADLGRR